MRRRTFVKAGLAGAALGSVPAADAAAAIAASAAARQHYELRRYELRSDLEPAQAQRYFGEQLAPALRRAGATAVALFTPEVGMATPGTLVVAAYDSLGAVGEAATRLAADAPFAEATGVLERGGRMPFVRYERALYRAFAGHPRLEIPPTAAGRAPRLFELRTYEAPHETGLRAKIAMFDQEEIRIFRACGFAPVFFGEAVAATRMPHLTYLVGFDDAAARAAAWAKFGANPDWQRIRVRPGWTDPETVSEIRNAFLRPAAGSDVR